MNEQKDYCFVIPVLPEKIDRMKHFWNELKTGRAEEIDSYMRSIGQSRLAEFLQTLPQGDFLVTYVKEAADPGTTFRESRKLDTPAARFVRDGFREFTGFDLTDPDTAPRVEKLREWEDEERTAEANRHAAFCVPVKPGRTGDLRRFFDAVIARTDEEVPVFRYQTVARMESFLQHRPEGDYLVEYVETTEPIANVMRKGLSTGRSISEFIKSGFESFCALPLPLSPDIELLFDWSAGAEKKPAAHAAKA